ncbi:MAG: DUF3027 domain-containing protein [Actinobacteria bacterium]|nr:DUF3027 domain-containing protein [Actinomycetota bacterium]
MGWRPTFDEGAWRWHPAVGEDGWVTPTSLDAALVSAVDLARSAVLEIAPAEHIGDHLEVTSDTDLMATHWFTCLNGGYQGWRWAVTVVRVPDSDLVTISEVVLLPGSGALLAPAWLPWSERVRPGDLGPGDLYPTSPDDPRLEPGYTGVDALDEGDETASPTAPLRPEQWELGLGRERVLSAYGRDLAVERWYEGDHGPDSAMAKAAPGDCGSCGFMLAIGGLVGQAFGVCANPFGADGRVVALRFGCGAHSSAREIEGTGVPVTEIAIDEFGIEHVDVRGESAPEALVAEGDGDATYDADDLAADIEIGASHEFDMAESDDAPLDVLIAADLDDVEDIEPDEILG